MSDEEFVFDSNGFVDLDFDSDDDLIKLDIDPGQEGTDDYNVLRNHPYINNEEVIGNKTSKDYKLQDEMDEISNQEIDEILFG